MGRDGPPKSGLWARAADQQTTSVGDPKKLMNYSNWDGAANGGLGAHASEHKKAT